MSAALTSDEMYLMAAVGTHLRVLGSPVAATFDALARKFAGLRHCNQCGVLFEGLPNTDECWHCQEDRRHGEAMEARGGGL